MSGVCLPFYRSDVCLSIAHAHDPNRGLVFRDMAQSPDFGSPPQVSPGGGPSFACAEAWLAIYSGSSVSRGWTKPCSSLRLGPIRGARMRMSPYHSNCPLTPNAPCYGLPPWTPPGQKSPPPKLPQAAPHPAPTPLGLSRCPPFYRTSPWRGVRSPSALNWLWPRWPVSRRQAAPSACWCCWQLLLVWLAAVGPHAQRKALVCAGKHRPLRCSLLFPFCSPLLLLFSSFFAVLQGLVLRA